MSSIINKNIFIKNVLPSEQIVGTKYDYSNSKNRMGQYAFVCPTNGEYSDQEKVGKNPDNRTQERFDEYKACGFNVLLILGNDKYSGEDFNSSQLKKNLDMPYVEAAIPHSNNTCLNEYPPIFSFNANNITHCIKKLALFNIINTILDINVVLFNISLIKAYLIDKKDIFI